MCGFTSLSWWSDSVRLFFVNERFYFRNPHCRHFCDGVLKNVYNTCKNMAIFVSYGTDT